VWRGQAKIQRFKRWGSILSRDKFAIPRNDSCQNSCFRKKTEYYGFSSAFRKNILEIEENKRKTEFFDQKSYEHAP